MTVGGGNLPSPALSRWGLLETLAPRREQGSFGCWGQLILAKESHFT